MAESRPTATSTHQVVGGVIYLKKVVKKEEEERAEDHHKKVDLEPEEGRGDSKDLCPGLGLHGGSRSRKGLEGTSPPGGQETEEVMDDGRRDNSDYNKDWEDDTESRSSSSDVSFNELEEGDSAENLERIPIHSPKRRKLARDDELNSGVEGEGSTIKNGGEANDGDRDGDPAKEYEVKTSIRLEEKGNTHEVLPSGWIQLPHVSGMPLYLHRETRVCTMARPYFLGPASARNHLIPVSAVPCLAYRGALQKEEEALLEFQELRNNVTKMSELNPSSQHKAPTEVKTATKPNCPFSKAEMTPAQSVDTHTPTPEIIPSLLPPFKVEPMNENAVDLVEPIELRTYCEKLFKFKCVTTKMFKRWSARKRYDKLKRKEAERPSLTLPEGVKLITFPTQNKESDVGVGGSSSKEFILNPQGKSCVCILHECVQRTLRKQPIYIFKKTEDPNTPHTATVLIDNKPYGTGYGFSKKKAKANAARAALEVLMPDMKDMFSCEDEPKTFEFDNLLALAYFDQVDILEPGIAQECARMNAPSPYTILVTCLQRNFGISASTGLKIEACNNPKGLVDLNKFRMSAGDFSTVVFAANKKQAKELGSQQLLLKINPSIRNFGSFLRLYGNLYVKPSNKKEEKKEVNNK